MIRRFLNGETHVDKLYVSMRESIAHGGEPGELKHLSTRRKRKKNSIPQVAASERGGAQTRMRASWGMDRIIQLIGSRTVLGKPARAGDSPVGETERKMAVSRVPRDTWNLVGRMGDHPQRLNTT